MRQTILALLAVLVGAGATAQSPRTLQNSGGGDAVLVWRNADAMREGYRLIDAGAHRSQPQLVLRLVACTAPNGTRIVVTDGGFFSSEVLVVDGRLAGCRGVTYNENIPR